MLVLNRSLYMPLWHCRSMLDILIAAVFLKAGYSRFEPDTSHIVVLIAITHMDSAA